MSAYVQSPGAPRLRGRDPDANGRADGSALEVLRMVATLGWVVVGTTIALAILGALPTILGGEPRGVRAAATVAEAERLLGVRLAEPGYFPERLGWPPAAIRVSGRRGGSAELVLAAKDGGSPIVILQAAPGGVIAKDLLGDPTELRSSPTTVGGVPARIADVVVDGETWISLEWTVRGRPVVLRTRGDVEELYRMARTTRVEGGP